MVSIQLNKVSEYKTILKLKKQRFKCKSCERTFCAECQITDRHCSISRRVKLAIGAYLDKPMSITLIAEHLRVSVQTVLRVLRSFRKPVLPEVDALPEVLCLDEFRSGKFAAGAMSCVMMDGQTGQLIDVLEDRRLNNLKQYFLRFPLEKRKEIRFVVSDFYSPYRSLTKALFPNAEVVIDRFHITKLINQTLMNHRIQVMNRLKNKCLEEEKHARHLKKY